MYALCIGVRNRFFSLSSFSEDLKPILEKQKDVIDAWCGPYRLDPSWDQGLNGQENLVWDRDGETILKPEHFQRGFFMHVVKESKDSEIHVWRTLRGFEHYNALSVPTQDGDLRIVRTFRALQKSEASFLRRAEIVRFGVDHLNWLIKRHAKEVLLTDVILPYQQPLPLKVRNDDRTTH